jgi:serpin B
MNRFSLLCAALCVLLFAAATRAEEKTPNQEAIVKANNLFTLSLYAKLRSEKGNLFFSPYSIADALAMTAAGARGETLAEMNKTLHLPEDQARTNAGFRELIKTINGNGKERKFQLSTANALWGQKGFNFLPSFEKTAVDDYHAALREVDFAEETEKSRLAINQWVEEQTKNKIKDLIPARAVDETTRLVLTNAIYFKAAWADEFREDDTKKEDFKLPGDKKIADVPFMHKTHDLNYFEGVDFQGLEIPYEYHQLQMVVLLPKKTAGLEACEKELTAENLAKWESYSKVHHVDLALPKFKFTASFKLKPVLMEMGMKQAFTAQADFSGISKSEGLMIDNVLHKAFVDVHEKGTEAAAATAVVVNRSAPPPRPKATFRADHPFIFFIRETQTGTILFMGRVTDPLPK